MYSNRKMKTTTRLALALALLLSAGLIQAATPPEVVNFEGVLRNASGVRSWRNSMPSIRRQLPKRR